MLVKNLGFSSYSVAKPTTQMRPVGFGNSNELTVADLSRPLSKELADSLWNEYDNVRREDLTTLGTFIARLKILLDMNKTVKFKG